MDNPTELEQLREENLRLREACKFAVREISPRYSWTVGDPRIAAQCREALGWPKVTPSWWLELEKKGISALIGGGGE